MISRVGLGLNFVLESKRLGSVSRRELGSLEFDLDAGFVDDFMFSDNRPGKCDDGGASSQVIHTNLIARRSLYTS